ncbi:molybdopterin-binding protein [Rhodobacter aestuarii]|uniref:Molybdenum-pterin binding domain-containing protein n=1 Tax=Rhodobacter aestuarii TaxID=453582 RepID=A0A1N7IYM9_9RHOB|nr:MULTISPECIES: TOBE domain-containing protein [Rhodobacter]PTV97392.1 molybdopterin-binding protein [Rhodobacter aestuarii]SIS42091.1 molybdenum-pterin binding domain-containing protein [Rhodobacter aestuarii]SOC00266.1 molybdopterin-binding protein [Rhodobacter sp. JA431]
MKLSARNILDGTITAVEVGQVTTHVKLDIGGATITASITNEAAADLGLKVGEKACAVIKSSDVIIGIA